MFVKFLYLASKLTYFFCYRKYGIKYEHLSALSDEDLNLLGMKSKKVREEVLAEISSLPNQMEHYDG